MNITWYESVWLRFKLGSQCPDKFLITEVRNVMHTRNLRFLPWLVSKSQKRRQKKTQRRRALKKRKFIKIWTTTKKIQNTKYKINSIKYQEYIVVLWIKRTMYPSGWSARMITGAGNYKTKCELSHSSRENWYLRFEKNLWNLDWYFSFFTITEVFKRC